MANIIPYEKYKHILNYPRYELGVYDCYTVIKDVLNSAYGVIIPNYARPENFDMDPLDLFTRIAKEDFFIERPTLDVKQFEAGDILSFKVKADRVNHVGVYLGNNLFLHQVHNSLPREDNISLSWLRRLAAVHYHQDVEQTKVLVDLIDLMPNHLKVERYVEQ